MNTCATCTFWASSTHRDDGKRLCARIVHDGRDMAIADIADGGDSTEPPVLRTSAGFGCTLHVESGVAK